MYAYITFLYTVVTHKNPTQYNFQSRNSRNVNVSFNFLAQLSSQDAREQCCAVFMKKKGKLQNICILE